MGDASGVSIGVVGSLVDVAGKTSSYLMCRHAVAVCVYVDYVSVMSCV